MSFLRNYLQYSTGNEAPEQFHVWGAYTCLSVAISRRVWLPFEDTAIYPNIYVMYVGAAGNGKSWAMQKAKRLLAEVPDVHVSGSLETPPGLWRWMAGDSKKDPPVPSPVMKVVRWPDGTLREIHPMTIIANEFVNFISLDEPGWINALNDIYDEDVYKYRTKNMGEDVLIGPYIVLLGALTTEVSNDLQKARIISTGLARRTIFQYGERQWLNPHAKPQFTEEQKAARVRARDHLRTLQGITGPVVWTPEVDEYWTAWYNPHLASVPERPPQTQGWYSTKPIQVLKLAMLTALGDRASLTLEITDFEVALGFLDSMEGDLEKIFGGVGRNELAAVAIKIYEYIANLREPVTKALLKTRFFAMCKPPNEFEDCFTYLQADGKIKGKFMTVGGYQGEIYATPEVMQAFEERVAATTIQPAAAIPSESRPVTAAVADPSTVQSQPPPTAGPLPPTLPPPVAGTAFVPPPRVV